MSRFKRAVRSLSINPAALISDSEANTLNSFLGWGEQPYSGKRMSRIRALQMVAVWRCVDLLASGVSTLPFDVFSGSASSDKANRKLPTPAWLQRPQPWQLPYDFWNRVMVSMLLDGNAFIWTQRDPATGAIVGLHVLDPRRVEPRLENGDIQFYVSTNKFDRSYILWIPAFTVDWQLRGLSPIDAARQAIDLGLTVEEFGAKFFHQGTSMAGVIEHPGTPEADEAEMLRKMFKKKHSGLDNSHALGILTGGAQWKNITITPEQAQFLETRKFQKTEVALLFGIPPYMVDPTVASSWGKGVEEQNQFFTVFSLDKYTNRIEQAVTTFLLPGKQYFKFNTDARLRPKTAERFAAYRVAIESGFMNRDEVRELEDKNPIPDGLGQVFYRPLNFAPLGVGPYEGHDPEGDGTPDPKKDEFGRLPDDPDYGKPLPGVPTQEVVQVKVT